VSKGFGIQPPDDDWEILIAGEIFTGIVQHPVTKLWQSWISLYGIEIACVTAHRSRETATQVAQKLAIVWQEGNLNTSEDVSRFIQSIESKAIVEPLPPKALKRLQKQIQSLATGN
jgi:hypothetical protein